MNQTSDRNTPTQQLTNAQQMELIKLFPLLNMMGNTTSNNPMLIEQQKKLVEALAVIQQQTQKPQFGNNQSSAGNNDPQSVLFNNPLFNNSQLNMPNLRKRTIFYLHIHFVRSLFFKTF